MKTYGSDHHPPGVGVQPDAADIRCLGMSSRHGNTPSSSRSSTRRIWKKKARAASRKSIRDAVNEED